MIKKLLSILIVLTFLISLCSCSVDFAKGSEEKYVSVAQKYISDNDFDSAHLIIEKGLKKYPESESLKNLRQQINGELPSSTIQNQEDMEDMEENDESNIYHGDSYYEDGYEPDNGPDISPEQNSNISSQSLSVGSHLYFGIYEQDGNVGNGKEQLEWTVLDVKDGKALLICSKVVDYACFDDSNNEINWNDSSMRSFLNKDFYEYAFSADEKNRILESGNSNSNSSDSNAYYQTESNEKVFLLSEEEADYYLKNNKSCSGTNYAISIGAPHDSANICSYWLRTQSGFKSTSYVAMSGAVFSSQNSVANGVRPVIWISL